MVYRGLVEDEDRAMRVLMSGLVYVDGQKHDKAGTMICVDSRIDVKEKLPFVSRGGLKLEKAIKDFYINFDGRTVMDIGASTGGFTDVALQNGAVKVFAVDSGKNQLHEKLKVDNRVVDLEKNNFRIMDFDVIGRVVDVIVCDVSFISLMPIIEALLKFCSENTDIILLIKPQFEAERKDIGKNGVVRDTEVHKEIIEKIINFGEDRGLSFSGLCVSPVKGPKGNIEYPVYFRYNKNFDDLDLHAVIRQVVDENNSYYR